MKKNQLIEHTMQKDQKRQTHLEVMGGIAYAVRSGYVARVLEVIECKLET